MTTNSARTVQSYPDPYHVFAGGREMGALMRAFDWSQTPLGPVSHWPHSLRTAVRIMLTSRYPMFIWWGKERTNLYNDPYRALLGRKHPDALGKSGREVWAEIWDEVGPRSDAVLQRGEATFDEMLLLLLERHGYLEETYFTFSYSPLPDDDGNVGGMFCAVTEETLQVIGRRRLALLHEIGAAMAEGRNLDQVCQSAARALSGAQRDLPFSLIYLLEADGKTVRRAGATGMAVTHPAAPASVSLAEQSVWPFQRVIETSETVLIKDLAEHVREIPHGEWSDPPTSAVLVPIAHQGQARPAGVFVAGVNPHRKLDEDFKGFLLLLVNQIAGAVSNAVAYETERRRAESLAELDRAKTLFFSNVSHEFRTPLTLTLGSLEELLARHSERLGPAEQQQVEVARRNALRLLKLVNTLLDFSRIEAGRVQAVYEPTDLASLTSDVAGVFRSAMEKAGLRFTVRCDPIPEPVYVDRDMWEKVVLNLLSNACKFTFEGDVELGLRPRNGSAELSVRDTGVGIAADELPRIFERFHRIENTRARTHEGTGIGLALVQELVKLHGGTVRVDSVSGQGSTFAVSIPLGKAHLPTDRIQGTQTLASTAFSTEAYLEACKGEVERCLPQDPDMVPHEQSLPGLGPESAPEAGVAQEELIVVADDNADMREYLRHLLHKHYRVQAVADGMRAVEATRQLRPALVLTDVMMPELDGFGVLRAVRSDPELSGTPVILLSARAGEESRVEGLDAGADDYLVKPFTARELLARVAAHIKMANLRRQAVERESRLLQRLAAIVESTDDAVISKDVNGIVTSWNSGAQKMFGYTAEEMVGRSITTIIPAELRREEEMILGKIRSGERIDHFDTVRVSKSGERMDVSLSLSPMTDENGQVIGAAKIARNITQNKKIEQSLRTTEKLAATGRMAATVAHEINNPLEAVTNLVYLAKCDLPDAVKVANHLELAMIELNRIAHIARQTLGFYRDSSLPTVFSVARLLDDLLAFYEKKLAGRNIHVIRQYGSNITMTALAGEIRQAFSNLISNSIDAMPLGGSLFVRVTRSCNWNDRRTPGVRITILDTGSGVAPEHMGSLFQPFFTTKTDVGTGLGLWITRNIIEKHRGSIHVKSRTGPEQHGTVFSIFLSDDVRSTALQETGNSAGDRFNVA
jgi:PAS domain S-box-containing protein